MSRHFIAYWRIPCALWLILLPVLASGATIQNNGITLDLQIAGLGALSTWEGAANQCEPAPDMNCFEVDLTIPETKEMFMPTVYGVSVTVVDSPMECCLNVEQECDENGENCVDICKPENIVPCAEVWLECPQDNTQTGPGSWMYTTTFGTVIQGQTLGLTCSFNPMFPDVPISLGMEWAKTSSWIWKHAWDGPQLDDSLYAKGNVLFVDQDVLYQLAQSESWGGPTDNPDTMFDGGSGAGACSEQGLPVYWINTSYLSLVIEDTDLAWTSFGHEVALRRVWNQTNRAGMFGNGWSFAYESSIRTKAYTASGATVRLGSGQRLDYAVASSEALEPEQVAVTYASKNTGSRPQLTATISTATNTGTYILRDKKNKITSTYTYHGFDVATGEFIYLLASVADRNGNALTLTHDGNGQLHTLTDASGRVVTFSHADGRCTGYTTFNGASAAFAYDGSGNLTQTIDLAGNITTYAYDAQNAVTSMTSVGKTTTFNYDQIQGYKRVVAVTDAEDRITSYAMDSSHDVTVTYPGGGTRAHSSENGRTTFTSGYPGGWTSTTYNAAGLPTTVIREWATTTHAYDDDGNLTSLTDPVGGVTRFAYDADWNLTSLTDPLNNVWSFEYDASGNLIKETTPLGRITTYTLTTKGSPTRITRPGGAQYDMTYDAHGNLLTLRDPLGNTRTLTYDNQGLNVWKSADPRGNERSFVFDANRRLTRINLPNARSIQYGYDCCAPISITDQGGAVTTLDRDNLLRPTKLTDPLENTTTYAYDVAGNLSSIIDPLDRTTTLTHGPSRQLASVADPLANTTRFGRDDRGNLSSVTTPRDSTTTFSHDLADRLLTVTDPLGRTTASLTHDAMGREASRTNGRGQTVALTRDADGRPTAKRHGSATVASYAWSTAGFLSSMWDSRGTTSFTRDAAGRVTTVTYPNGKTLGLAYDEAGNLASLTYPGNLTATYTYDSLNRPTRVSFAGKIIDLGYDLSGNLSTETHSNGLTSVYAHDAAGRLTGVSHVKGAATIANIGYARDAAGAITQESGTWPLFPALRNASDTAAYTQADGIGIWKGDAFVYDEDGNLTSMGGARTLSATYDPENRMTSLTAGGLTREYRYNALGQRVRITAGSVTRNLHHDPFGRLLFETNASGTVTTQYVYVGPFLVAQGTPSGGFTRLLRDKTGNALALVDDAGNVTAAYAYGDYGLPAGKTGSASTSFTYVGALGVMDEGDDFYFMKNRVYDAKTGRFLQRDPISFKGGNNLYRYVDGNPISYVDPEGTVAAEILFGAVFLYGLYKAEQVGKSFQIVKPLEKTAEYIATDDGTSKESVKQDMLKACSDIKPAQDVLNIQTLALDHLGLPYSVTGYVRSVIFAGNMTYTGMKLGASNALESAVGTPYGNTKFETAVDWGLAVGEALVLTLY